VFSRELYFAPINPSPRRSAGRSLQGFAPDFFDLIIVDECHRGSAKEDFNWREILEYFQPAYQLGMTATPLRDENRDTYLYFGNPIYTYSSGRASTTASSRPTASSDCDAVGRSGLASSTEDLDRYGRRIPDEVYGTPDFERKSPCSNGLNDREAPHRFPEKDGRFAKTIVFCVDQEHASEMRAALNNLNADIVGQASSPAIPAASRRRTNTGRDDRSPAGGTPALHGYPITSAASPPTKATSAAATCSGFRTSRRARP